MVHLNNALISLLGLASSVGGSPLKVSSKAKAKADFLAVMNRVSHDHGLELTQKIDKAQLTKTILSKSVRAEHGAGLRKNRRIEEEEADDEAVEADDGAVEEEEEAEQDDKYYDAFQGDDAYDFSDIFFDISKYSIKFHSCATIKDLELDNFLEEEEEDDDGNDAAQYYNNEGEEEEAEEEDDGEKYPYTTTQVINYRLCPSDTCQDNSWKGCRTNYGNYMIGMEDYFEAQEEYIEEVFEQYCDYCAQCLYMYKYFNAQCEYYDECEEYSSVCYEQEEEECDDDGKCNNQDDGEDEEEVTFQDFMECKEVEVLENSFYYHMCSYCSQCDYMFHYFNAECNNYSSCSGYEDICADADNRRLEEGDDANDEYAQRYYENQNVNEQVFMKIYCDGSLQVGMFADNECKNYISDKVNMYETTGLYITADDLGSEYMSSECISCSRKGIKYFHGDGDYQQAMNDDEEEDEDELLEICEKIYEDSLKCNENLQLNVTAYLNENGYYDEQVFEEWNETITEKACAFLEAVQKGEIDSNGYASTSKYYEENKSVWSSDYWNNKKNDFTDSVNNNYMPSGYTLSTTQMTVLIMLFFGSVVFLLYSILFKPNRKEQHNMKVSLVKNSNGISA